jgi:hypothetical protein
MNAAAQAILDDNVKIRDRRIVLRDAESRGRLKEAIDSLRMTPRLTTLIADRIIVPRIDKLPVILRIWPCSGETQGEGGGARFVMTLNALGPKPGAAGPCPHQNFRIYGVRSTARLRYGTRHPV